MNSDIKNDITIGGRKATKLKAKLRNRNLTARELRALLLLSGWRLDRVRGSHEFWVLGAQIFVLATHGQDLKPYQAKRAAQLLLGEK